MGAFGTDGTTLVTGGADCCAMVWDVHDAPASKVPGVLNLLRRRTCVRPDPRHCLTGFKSAVVSVAVNTGLDTVVSVTSCGQCLIHSLRKGRALMDLQLPDEIVWKRPSFHPIRRSSGGGSGDRRPHASTIGAVVPQETLPRFVIFTQDGSIVFYSDSALVSADGERTVCKLSVCTINGRYWRSVELDSPATAMVSNPEGSLLLIGSKNGDITLRRTDTLEIVRGFESAGCCITSVRFSQDGHCVLVGTKTGELKVYDATIARCW